MFRLVYISLLGLTLLASITNAEEKPIDILSCCSATTTMLTADKDLVIFTCDIKGIDQDLNTDKVFENFTHNCTGTIRILHGEILSKGYCKYNPRAEAVRGAGGVRNPDARSAFADFSAVPSREEQLGLDPDWKNAGFDEQMAIIGTQLGLKPHEAIMIADGRGAIPQDIREAALATGKWKGHLGGSASNHQFEKALEAIARDSNHPLAAKADLFQKGFKPGEFHYLRGQHNAYGPAGYVFRVLNALGPERAAAVINHPKFKKPQVQLRLAQMGRRIMPGFNVKQAQREWDSRAAAAGGDEHFLRQLRPRPKDDTGQFNINAYLQIFR